MSDIVNSNISYSGLVEKYIGSAYDTVKIVSDNIDAVIKVAGYEGLEDLDEIAEQVKEDADRADAAAAAAEGSATAAATSAQDAADSASSIGDAEQTCLDAVTITNANVVLTNADAASTAADRAQTQIDAAATKADATQTAADRVQTQQDVVTTGNNAAIAVAAKDEAEIALDEFTDFYLGAHATPPAFDNDGDPLIVGALYQDTTATPDVMKFWDGAAWLIAYATTDVADHSSLSNLATDAHNIYMRINGTLPMTAATPNFYGSESLPGITFDGDPDTGLYHQNTNVLGISVAGANVATFDVAGLNIVGNITLSGTVDGVDIASLPDSVSAKEDDLGDPAASGQCLVSTSGGTRSWETRATPLELTNGLALKENVLGYPDVDDKVLVSDNLANGGARSWVAFKRKWTDLEDTTNEIVDEDIGKFVAVNAGKTLDFVANIVSAAVGVNPPANPGEGALWLNSNTGYLYSWYTNTTGNDPFPQQWIRES